MRAQINFSLREFGKASVPPIVSEIVDENLQVLDEFVISADQWVRDLEGKPGYCFLRAMLPSGVTIDKKFELRKGGDNVDLDLGLCDVPHDLAYGYYLGDLPKPMRRYDVPDASWADSIRALHWKLSDREWRVVSPTGMGHPQLPGWGRLSFITFESAGKAPQAAQILGLGELSAAFMLPPRMQGAAHLIVAEGEQGDGPRVHVLGSQPDAAFLFGYLANGNFRSAAILARHIDEKLRRFTGDRVDPDLGIALGYHIMRTGSASDWPAWWPAFARLYSWVPDVGVIHAWLTLAGQNADGEVEAAEILIRSLDHSPPVFAIGVDQALSLAATLRCVTSITPEQRTALRDLSRRLSQVLDAKQGGLTRFIVDRPFLREGADAEKKNLMQKVEIRFRLGGDQIKKIHRIDEFGRMYATGRRKTAVARVWLKPGNGEVVVNNRELGGYFVRPRLQMEVLQPFFAANRVKRYDVMCTVNGGGHSGQAGAIRLGISKALTAFEPELRPSLREAGLLTRDSRAVERKKYGRAKARKSFQYSKR